MPARKQRVVDLGVAAGLYVAAVLLLVFVASSLGVAEGEPPRLQAAVDASALSMRALVARDVAAIDRALGTSHAPLPILLAGMSWRSLSQHAGLRLQELVALRLGPILFSAAIPAGVFVLARRSLGRSTALVAAAFAFFAPRALEQETLLSGDGPLAASIVWALAAYERASESRSTRGRLVWSALSALVVGFGLANAWAALLALPAILVHAAIERPEETGRALGRGVVHAPAAFVFAFVLAPIGLLVASPWLWHDTGDRLRDLLVAAAQPHVGAGTWNGGVPLPEAIPRAHAVAMTLLSLPSITSVLAVVGVATAIRDEHAPSSVSLAIVALAVFLGWPLVAPPALGVFPSHFLVAIPLVAIVAAHGACTVTRALLADGTLLGRRRRVLLAFLVLLAIAACHSPSTYAADFPLLAGGTARARRARMVPLHDGTPLGKAIVELNATISGDATALSPTIHQDVFDWSTRLGRLRSRVRVVRSGPADLIVASGVVPDGPLVVDVRREAQPVLAIARSR